MVRKTGTVRCLVLFGGSWRRQVGETRRTVGARRRGWCVCSLAGVSVGEDEKMPGMGNSDGGTTA